jgi:succinyl-diaminopimelate desuccinylase
VTELAERLASRTLELVDIASTSGHEDELLEALEVPGDLPVLDAQDAVRCYGPLVRRTGVPRAVLAGHVDTVPPNGNLPGRLEADSVIGLGAADMKGALAVMEVIAADVAAGLRCDVDLFFVFFGREELPIAQSALLPLLARCPELRDADLAIVMEPTANAIEVGCLGNMDVRLRFRGQAAHSARPWLGENAIHAAVRALSSVAALGPRDVDVDGLTYREVVSVTMINGGLAANVVPDLVEARVNYRYAPGIDPTAAESTLRAMLPGADLEIVSNAPPGSVNLRNALVDRLRRASDLEIRPKQAWTSVAEFATIGVDAVNLGPGDPGYAHRDDERVEVAALVRSVEVLRSFLADGAVAEEDA